MVETAAVVETDRNREMQAGQERERNFRKKLEMRSVLRPAINVDCAVLIQYDIPSLIQEGLIWTMQFQNRGEVTTDWEMRKIPVKHVICEKEQKPQGNS